MTRRGVTLAEALIAAAIGLVLMAILVAVWTSTSRAQQVADRHLDALVGATLALHQLRTDLRQISFVPGRPVEGHSLRVGADHRSVRLRRSAPTWPGQPPGSAFTVVEYALEPLDGSRSRLVRTQWTASGAHLPRRAVSREETALRSTAVTDFTVLYQEDEAADTRLLHIALEVTAAHGEHGRDGPGGAPRLLVTSAIQLSRPEPAFGGAWPLFAEPLPDNLLDVAEVPPGEVRAPEAVDAGPLP